MGAEREGRTRCGLPGNRRGGEEEVGAAGALVAVAGAAVALQTPINAALGRNIGSGVAAAAVSFGVGFAILLGVLLMRGELGALPRAASASPVLLLGGVLGAFYVWSVLWAIPTLDTKTQIPDNTDLLKNHQFVAPVAIIP